jgi:hypothetical protein
LLVKRTAGQGIEALRARRDLDKIHLNPNVEFLISNLVACCMVTSIFYLSSSVLNERATIKPWSNIELF